MRLATANAATLCKAVVEELLWLITEGLGHAFQVRCCCAAVCVQLAAAKGGEIEELLGQLSDVNDEMGSALSGAGDSRAHTLARHREIMVELTQARLLPELAVSEQESAPELRAGRARRAPRPRVLSAEPVGAAQEFRRLSTALGAARDRADLLPASTSDTSALLGMQARQPGVSAGSRSRASMHASCALRVPLRRASTTAAAMRGMIHGTVLLVLLLLLAWTCRASLACAVLPPQSSAGLLRERGAVQGAHSAVRTRALGRILLACLPTAPVLSGQRLC